MAKTCPSCGYIAEDDNQFCNACGAALDAPPEPVQSEAPAASDTFVPHEAPVYSVNAVRPAEAQYTSPYEPVPHPTVGMSAPPQRKKRTGLLIALSALVVAVIALFVVLGFTQGWFGAENHQLDGQYRLTGFVNDGKDYSASLGALGTDYTLSVSGSDCTLRLGEGDSVQLHMDQSSGTMSNASSRMTYTVTESGGVPSISISSADTVLTFTRE